MAYNTRRILRDYEELVKYGPENGIWIKPTNVDKMDCFSIMMRVKDGPYNGTLWFFSMELQAPYPAKPPKVLHQSIWSKSIHPNIFMATNDRYIDNVCLSILKLDDKLGWTPMYTFLHIFLSILSIIDNEPLRNASTYDHGFDDLVQTYSEHVQYVSLQETFDRVFLPTMKHSSTNSYCKIFEDEIKKIWQTDRQWYYDYARSLELLHTVVINPEYGDRSYTGSPYKFTSLDSLMI